MSTLLHLSIWTNLLVNLCQIRYIYAEGARASSCVYVYHVKLDMLIWVGDSTQRLCICGCGCGCVCVIFSWKSYARNWLVGSLMTVPGSESLLTVGNRVGSRVVPAVHIAMVVSRDFCNRVTHIPTVEQVQETYFYSFSFFFFMTLTRGSCTFD